MKHKRRSLLSILQQKRKSNFRMYPETQPDGNIIYRSHYCKKCDAKYQWQCNCPNHKAMADQRQKYFPSGKRYKGKTAWQLTHLDEDDLTNMKNDPDAPSYLKG